MSTHYMLFSAAIGVFMFWVDPLQLLRGRIDSSQHWRRVMRWLVSYGIEKPDRFVFIVIGVVSVCILIIDLLTSEV